MAVATELVYTEKEMEAIKALEANRGSKLNAKQLGVPSVILTSLRTKANKFADQNPVIVNSEKVTDVCPTCGAKHEYTLYWID